MGQHGGYARKPAGDEGTAVNPALRAHQTVWGRNRRDALALYGWRYGRHRLITTAPQRLLRSVDKAARWQVAAPFA